MAQEHDGIEAVAWLALGALVGAAAALLLAPASGEETRHKLGEWMTEAKHGSEKLLREAREKATDQKDRLGQAFRAGRKAYREHEHEGGETA